MFFTDAGNLIVVGSVESSITCFYASVIQCGTISSSGSITARDFLNLLDCRGDLNGSVVVQNGRLRATTVTGSMNGSIDVRSSTSNPSFFSNSTGWIENITVNGPIGDNTPGPATVLISADNSIRSITAPRIKAVIQTKSNQGVLGAITVNSAGSSVSGAGTFRGSILMGNALAPAAANITPAIPRLPATGITIDGDFDGIIRGRSLWNPVRVGSVVAPSDPVHVGQPWLQLADAGGTVANNGLFRWVEPSVYTGPNVTIEATAAGGDLGAIAIGATGTTSVPLFGQATSATIRARGEIGAVTVADGVLNATITAGYTGAAPNPEPIASITCGGNFSSSLVARSLGTSTIGGNLTGSITLSDGLPTGATLKINGSITGTGALSFGSSGASPGLNGQVIVNAANAGGAWAAGTVQARGTTLAPVPAFEQAGTAVGSGVMLGGRVEAGAVGLAPFRFYQTDSIPSSAANNALGVKAVLGNQQPIRASYYGPIMAASTPMTIQFR